MMQLAHPSYRADMAQLAHFSRSRLEVSNLINTISLPTMSSMTSLPRKTFDSSIYRESIWYVEKALPIAGSRPLRCVRCRHRSSTFAIRSSWVLLLAVLSALSSAAAPARPVCFGGRSIAPRPPEGSGNVQGSIKAPLRAIQGVGHPFSPATRACDLAQVI
jgi:hypothetical protein